MPDLSSVKPSHSVARHLVRGREWVRAVGRDAAVDALRRALCPWDRAVRVTRWTDGVPSTYGGSASKPGAGRAWDGSLAEYARMREAYAREIHAKRTGLVIAHGLSWTGGSRDEECVLRTAVFGDCDGLGDWHRLRGALDSVGAAYLMARSASHTAAIPKWHVELFLARPIAPPRSGVADWKRDVYMPALGWVLGVLSEIAELACDAADDHGRLGPARLGFDPSTSRLLQPCFPGCRQVPSSPAPEIVWRDGSGVDWESFLSAMNFRPEVSHRTTPTRKPLKATSRPDPRAHPFVKALDAAGWLVGPVGHDRFAVRCPWEDKHTLGTPGDTSTVAWRDGGWHCSHAHCAGRTRREIVNALPAAVRAVYDAEIEGVGVRRVREKLAASVPPPSHPAVELSAGEEHIERAVRAAFEKDGCTVIRASCGVGKSRVALRVLAEHGSGVYTASTNAIADAARQELETQGTRVRQRRGVLAVVNADGKPACMFYERARMLQDAGASVPHLLCRCCPHREGCPAREADGADGDIEVTSHALLPAVASTSAPAAPIVLDEGMALTMRMTVPYDRLDAARALLAGTGVRLVTRRFRGLTGPFLAILCRAIRTKGDLTRAAADYATSRGEDIDDLFREWHGGRDVPTGDTIADARKLACMASADLNVVLAPSIRDELTAVGDDTAGRVALLLHVLRAVKAAAQEGAHLSWDDGALSVTYPTEITSVVKHARRLVILDATAPIAALRAVRPDLHAVTVNVADAARITRVVLYYANGAPRKMAPRRSPDWDAILARVQDVLGAAADAGVERLLLVTHKRIAEAIRRGDSAVEPLLVAWRAAPREVDVRWYGATSGLNAWSDFDGCATIGDPWPNLPAQRGRAAVIGLDEDATDASLYGHAAAELAQVHGRLRDVRRAAPAWHIHVGAVVPEGWHAGNTTVESLRRGRRPTEAAMEAAELRTIVTGLGGVRAAARHLEIPRRTLRDYLAGKKSIPAAVVERVRVMAIAPGRADGAEVGAKRPIKKESPHGPIRAHPGAAVLPVPAAVAQRSIRAHPAAEPSMAAR